MTAEKIEILGPGCARCRETHRVVREAVERSGLAVAVEKDESVDRMLELGVLRTPAVAIDGKVVLSGHIPKVEEIEQLLGVGRA